MTKIVFITSVCFMGNNGMGGPSYATTYVHDLPDITANDYVAKGYAIPFVGWETHPKRPPVIRFPQ